MSDNDWIYDYEGKIYAIVALLGGPGIAYGIWLLLGIENPSDNFAVVMILLIFGYCMSFLIAWRLHKFFDRYK